MLLMGKKVPARNIMGNVTMLPMTPAVSGFFVTVPTSIPSAAKSIGPRMRKGINQGVIATCAPKANMPTPTISKKPAIVKTMYQMTLDASHSIFVSGVSESCLNSFVFLYSEEMLTSENIGLVSIEKPIKPGIKKSMYFVCCVFTVADVIPMIAGVVSLYFVWK